MTRSWCKRRNAAKSRSHCGELAPPSSNLNSLPSPRCSLPCSLCNSCLLPAPLAHLLSPFFVGSFAVHFFSFFVSCVFVLPLARPLDLERSPLLFFALHGAFHSSQSLDRMRMPHMHTVAVTKEASPFKQLQLPIAISITSTPSMRKLKLKLSMQASDTCTNSKSIATIALVLRLFFQNVFAFASINAGPRTSSAMHAVARIRARKRRRQDERQILQRKRKRGRCSGRQERRRRMNERGGRCREQREERRALAATEWMQIKG